MRTNILKQLHQRSINQLELIDECTKLIEIAKGDIKIQESKSKLDAFLFTSRREYEDRIEKYKSIQIRLKEWYHQTNHKINLLKNYD